MQDAYLCQIRVYTDYLDPNYLKIVWDNPAAGLPIKQWLLSRQVHFRLGKFGNEATLLYGMASLNMTGLQIARYLAILTGIKAQLVFVVPDENFSIPLPIKQVEESFPQSIQPPESQLRIINFLRELRLTHGESVQLVIPSQYRYPPS